MSKMLFVCVLVALATTLPAVAEVISFQYAAAPDMYDLDHGKWYEWGMSWNRTAYDPASIRSAWLTVSNVYDNTHDPQNVVFAEVLDTPRDGVGVRIGSDNESLHSDYFASSSYPNPHEFLTAFHDTQAGDTPQNWRWDFNATDLSKLKSYASNNGLFGIGLDPDCHFVNTGIKLNVEWCARQDTPPTPELGTWMLLACSGLAGALVTRRRKS